MQRGTYAISVSAQMVEGGLVARGEALPAYHQTLLLPADDKAVQDGPGMLLGAFLQQSQWERGLAVLVLPTRLMTSRRLHFQFAEPRKIRQVLPFELQNELLEPLDDYVYDAQIAARGDGTADVTAFFLSKAELEPLVAVIEQHQLVLHRVTFAAQALAESVPPASPSHFCVYVGSDESCVVHLVAGRLQAVQLLEAHPGAELEALRALGPGSPLEHLQALHQASAEDAARAGIRERLRDQLTRVVNEANRFLRVQGAGAPYTVSLHGLFAETCAWRDATGELVLEVPTGRWPAGQRTHLGMLQALLEQPRSLGSARSFNLRRRLGTWMAAVRELRWPLAVAGVLLFVLVAIAGAGFQLRAGALEQRLQGLERELQRMLSMPGAITTAGVNAAVAGMQERLERLRRDREAVAYLERYHYDILRLVRDVSNVVHEQPALTVENLTFHRDRMSLAGITPNYADAETLRNRLAALPRFEGQTLKLTNAAAGQVIRYRITVER